jgi:ribonuclease E
VLETTRLGIEVKNLKMRVESLTSRLEFNERRARALESVVVYKPSPEDRVEPVPARELRHEEPAPVSREAGRPSMSGGQPPQQQQPEGPGQRSRRRRRRRGRRGGGGSAAAMMGQAQGAPGQGPATQAAPAGDAQEPQGTSDRLERYEAAHHEVADLEPESPDEQDTGDAEGHDGDQ